jgi:prefoldin subunit 2
MDAGRKCYRLVGDVLVQRTVGETLPAVERNKANLDGLVAKLKATLEAQQKQLAEFQAK